MITDKDRERLYKDIKDIFIDNDHPDLGTEEELIKQQLAKYITNLVSEKVKEAKIDENTGWLMCPQPPSYDNIKSRIKQLEEQTEMKLKSAELLNNIGEQ